LKIAVVITISTHVGCNKSNKTVTSSLALCFLGFKSNTSIMIKD